MLNNKFNVNHNLNHFARFIGRMVFIFLFAFPSLNAEYINSKMKFVKQGFLSNYYKEYLEKDEVINWDDDVLIINNDDAVYSVLNRTLNINNETCIVIVNLITDKKSIYVIDKNIKDISYCFFSNNKLFIGTSNKRFFFEIEKTIGETIHCKYADSENAKHSCSQSDIKLIKDSLFVRETYPRRMLNNPDGRNYSIISIDSKNNVSKEKYLNNPHSQYFDFYQPKSSIAFSNNIIASGDNSKYNIFIYDKNCNPIDTIHGKFPTKNYISDEELADFDKSIDYKEQPGEILLKVENKGLWGKISVLKNINLINDSTILLCYSIPKNTIDGGFESLFDYNIAFDIWKNINGKWQLDDRNRNLLNQPDTTNGMIAKETIGIYDYYNLGSKYMFVNSTIPFIINDPIPLTEYNKMNDEYYSEKNNPGTYFIYTFHP